MPCCAAPLLSAGLTAPGAGPVTATPPILARAKSALLMLVTLVTGFVDGVALAADPTDEPAKLGAAVAGVAAIGAWYGVTPVGTTA